MMMSGLARSPANIRLEAQRGIALHDARGVELTVVSGGLWVTMENDPRDVILRAGDSRPIERDGLTLVNAFEPSMVQVREAPLRQATWRRWLAAAWDYLVLIGEARARARMQRGLHYLQV